ncbi:TonB-dependent receptor [Ideonella livida]|uniref:TonB-dependent receptor n=1 Tax=Ideonella livida TaxID=2707176 RepID=A0A7C9TM74_9BURK|nr:TonB-dependent receptor [Ideonella livida]NDY93841.1 TonB-dependent receptor [Ideonella livida]
MAAALSWAPLVAWAQAAAPATGPTTGPTSPQAALPDAAFEVGRVTVTGRASGPLSTRQLLTSVDVVGGSALQDQPVRHTWELARQVPGVLLTEFNQGTTSGKLSMRGFNGEGEVNAVKLLIDGVPSNTNDGNMPYIDLVLPLEVEALTTVRGTNDARYGLHNIAGNAELSTRQSGTDTAVRATAGSFAYRDLQAVTGLEGGGFSQTYSLGARSSEGFRDHARFERYNLGGQWFYQASGQPWRVGLSARALHHVAQEPGYLTAADAQDHPQMSNAYNATDGGSRDLSQISLRAEGQATADLSWQAIVWRNRYEDQRFVRFSAAGSQQERDTDETHMGLRTLLSWRVPGTPLHRLAVEGGLDTERQDNRSQRHRTVDRSRAAQTRDQQWNFNTVGAFAQAVVEPSPQWRLVPAWRVDRLSGQFHDLMNAVDADLYAYGSLHSPKFSAQWRPDATQTWYGNWGRTFQVGVGRASYKYTAGSAEQAPSTNDGWELGWKFLGAQPGAVGVAGLSGRVALWQQKATDEVMRKLNDPANDSENIGATRRRGLDVQLRAQPVPAISTWLAWTRQEALIVTPDSSSGAQAGNEVDHVPHQLLQAGADWQASARWRLGATLFRQSDYFIERTNTRGRFGGTTLLDLNSRWTLQPGATVELTLKNLTNALHEYAWWDTSSGQSLHSPGDGRALYLSWRVDL